MNKLVKCDNDTVYSLFYENSQIEKQIRTLSKEIARIGREKRKLCQTRDANEKKLLEWFGEKKIQLDPKDKVSSKGLNIVVVKNKKQDIHFQYPKAR